VLDVKVSSFDINCEKPEKLKLNCGGDVNRKFLGNTENSPALRIHCSQRVKYFEGKEEEKSFECLSLFNVNESS
jgi:hypothetical protein